MPNNKKSRQNKRERQADAQIRNADVPGAPRADSPTDLAALNANAGPLFFFDPAKFGGFMAPESEACERIRVDKVIMEEGFPDEAYRHKLDDSYCGAFFSAEHMFLTFTMSVGHTHQKRMVMSKNREQLLDRVWDELYPAAKEDDDPAIASANGRGARPLTVRRYWSREWEDVEVDFVVQCLFRRSTQKRELVRQLLATKGRDLVYAHPTDRTLGIGYDCKNAKQNRNTWGDNLWGLALQNFRDGKIGQGKTLEQVLEDIEKLDERKAAAAAANQQN